MALTSEALIRKMLDLFGARKTSLLTGVTGSSLAAVRSVKSRVPSASSSSMSSASSVGSATASSPMAEWEQTVLEAITKLTNKLTSMENKLDKFVGDLGAVCTKMDMVVTSIGLVHQEQVQFVKLLQSRTGDSHPDNALANMFEGFDQGPGDLAPARISAGLDEDPLVDEVPVPAAAESSSGNEFVFDSNVAAPASSIGAPITCLTEFPTTVVDSALALVPRSLQQFTRSKDTGVLDPICRGVNTFCSSIRDCGELFLVNFEFLLHVHAFSTAYFVKHQSVIPHSVATDVCESKFWDPGLTRGLGFKEFGMASWVVSSCAEFYWDPGLPVVITRSGADNYPASIHGLATNWLTQRQCGGYCLSLLQMHQLVALGTYVTLPVLACGELYHIAWQLQLVDCALSNIVCSYIACDSEFIPASEVIWALGHSLAGFHFDPGLAEGLQFMSLTQSPADFHWDLGALEGLQSLGFAAFASTCLHGLHILLFTQRKSGGCSGGYMPGILLDGCFAPWHFSVAVFSGSSLGSILFSDSWLKLPPVLDRAPDWNRLACAQLMSVVHIPSLVILGVHCIANFQFQAKLVYILNDNSNQSYGLSENRSKWLTALDISDGTNLESYCSHAEECLLNCLDTMPCLVFFADSLATAVVRTVAIASNICLKSANLTNAGDIILLSGYVLIFSQVHEGIICVVPIPVPGQGTKTYDNKNAVHNISQLVFEIYSSLEGVLGVILIFVSNRPDSLVATFLYNSIVQWILGFAFLCASKETTGQCCFILLAIAVQSEKLPRAISLRNPILIYFVPHLVDPGNSYSVIIINLTDKLCDSSLWSKSLIMHMATDAQGVNNSQFLSATWEIHEYTLPSIRSTHHEGNILQGYQLAESELPWADRDQTLSSQRTYWVALLLMAVTTRASSVASAFPYNSQKMHMKIDDQQVAQSGLEKAAVIGMIYNHLFKLDSELEGPESVLKRHVILNEFRFVLPELIKWSEFSESIATWEDMKTVAPAVS